MSSKYKEKLQKEAHERYQNLFEEEKEKKGRFHWDRNKKFSEEKKYYNNNYMRNYYLAHKN